MPKGGEEKIIMSKTDEIKKSVRSKEPKVECLKMLIMLDKF